MVDREGIVVVNKKTQDPVDICTGQEAYFAILAQDMYNIADKYKMSMADVHKIFYEVNCDRDLLISYLKKGKVKLWTTLEDLALRHSEDTPSYQVVL